MHDQFRDLHAHTRETLADLAGQWAAGELSAHTFAEAMDATLLLAHTEAVVIGRTHAGDDTPEEADDARFAGEVMNTEREFLDRFRLDLMEGRYTGEDGVRDGDAVAARAVQYSGRVTGTCNEAWSLTLPPDTLLWWRLQSEVGACTDCPELADASPWLPGTLIAHPGSNHTACRTSCRCDLETEDGARGFVTP